MEKKFVTNYWLQYEQACVWEYEWNRRVPEVAAKHGVVIGARIQDECILEGSQEAMEAFMKEMMEHANHQ